MPLGRTTTTARNRAARDTLQQLGQDATFRIEHANQWQPIGDFNGLLNDPAFAGNAATAAEMIRLQEARNAERVKMEAAREEARKKERMPVTITLEAPSDTRSPYYRVIITQNGAVVDEYSERTLENASRLFEDLKDGYQSRITTRHFDAAGDTPRRDLRGDRIIPTFVPRHERVNRRAVRPDEDVVGEAGLIVDIPDQIASQEAPAFINPVREFADELEEELLDAGF